MNMEVISNKSKEKKRLPFSKAFKRIKQNIFNENPAAYKIVCHCND